MQPMNCLILNNIYLLVWFFDFDEMFFKLSVAALSVLLEISGTSVRCSFKAYFSFWLLFSDIN